MNDKPFEFDYSMYGTWNGKPMLPSYNREQRRAYIKKFKNNICADYCPFCKTRTFRITDDNSNVCCELCGKIIEKSKKVEEE